MDIGNLDLDAMAAKVQSYKDRANEQQKQLDEQDKQFQEILKRFEQQKTIKSKSLQEQVDSLTEADFIKLEEAVINRRNKNI